MASGVGGTGTGMEVTTVMLRNVPRRYTPQALLFELERFVPHGGVDLLYLPAVQGSDSNLGYAFVNFVRPEHAARILSAMGGGTWTALDSTKKIKVVPAYVQGLRNNMLQCANMLEREDSSRDPLLFLHGEQVDFRSVLREHFLLTENAGRPASRDSRNEDLTANESGKAEAPGASATAPSVPEAGTGPRPVPTRLAAPFAVEVSLLRDIGEVFDIVYLL